MGYGYGYNERVLLRLWPWGEWTPHHLKLAQDRNRDHLKLPFLFFCYGPGGVFTMSCHKPMYLVSVATLLLAFNSF